MRKKMKKEHVWILICVILVFIWSAIKPAAYPTWLLEVSPAIAVWICVLALYKKFRLTTLSFGILAYVTILMMIGGHYIYSKVPLFEWIMHSFDLKRNHYDRFGHLMKGLISIIIREILLRRTPLKKDGWLVFIVLSVIMAIASLYEIIEWLFSKINNGGKAAKDFLGTQGDIWDTQWDMLLTFSGAVLTLLLLSKLHDKFLAKEIYTNTQQNDENGGVKGEGKKET